MKRVAIVTRERDVRTYAELWHASGCVLEVGERERLGSSFQFLSSTLLTAFAMEAYLNHVGPTVLSSWSSLERISWRAKLDLLCELLKIKLPGKGERPLRTINELFRFRNTIAHGRTHSLEPPAERIDPKDVDEYFNQRLLTDWEKLIED